MASQMTAAINITDGEQSPEQPPNVIRTGGGYPDEAPMEQPKGAKLEELAEAKRQQTEEPEPEAPRLVEPGMDRAGEEE